MELYYRRVETVRKGRTIPARTQTVVIYLPDVRSCLPTRLEWDEICIKYKNHLEMKQKSNEDDDDEENADVEKKHSHSKLTNSDIIANDDIETADVEMADEEKIVDTDTDTGGDNQNQDKQLESTDAKTATDSEATANAAAISKALLNIISNFTTDISYYFCFSA